MLRFCSLPTTTNGLSAATSERTRASPRGGLAQWVPSSTASCPTKRPVRRGAKAMEGANGFARPSCGCEACREAKRHRWSRATRSPSRFSIPGVTRRAPPGRCSNGGCLRLRSRQAAGARQQKSLSRKSSRCSSNENISDRSTQRRRHGHQGLHRRHRRWQQAVAGTRRRNESTSATAAAPAAAPAPAAPAAVLCGSITRRTTDIQRPK